MMHGQYYRSHPLAYNGPRRTSGEERPGLLHREQMHREATRAYNPTLDGKYEAYDDEGYDDDGYDDDGYDDDDYDDDDYDDEVDDTHSMVLHDHTKIRTQDH